MIRRKKLEKSMKPIKQERIKKSKIKAVIGGTKHFPTIIDIPKNQETFTYNNRSYNIDFQDIFILKIKSIFNNKFYVFYHFNNPNPIIMNNDTFEPKFINSSVYNSVLNTQIIRQANLFALRKNIFENIKIEYVIAGLVIIGIIMYFITGGKLT